MLKQLPWYMYGFTLAISCCVKTSNIPRRVVESFSGRVCFSKFRAGLLKYYMFNLISDLFKVPSCEYMCK